MDIKNQFADETIKAFNEGYRVGCRETESKHIETIRVLTDRITELEGKSERNRRRIAEEVKSICSTIYDKILECRCAVCSCHGLNRCSHFDCVTHTTLAIVDGDRWLAEVSKNPKYKAYVEAKE